MDKKKDLIIIGTTSKFGNFIFKYPLHSVIILFTCVAFFLLLCGEPIKRVLIGCVMGLIAVLPFIFIWYISAVQDNLIF